MTDKDFNKACVDMRNFWDDDFIESDFLKSLKATSDELLKDLDFKDTECGGFVYVIKNTVNNLYKIGVTKGDYKVRFRQLKTQSGCNLKTIFLGSYCVYEDRRVNSIEGDLHKKFRDKNTMGEWFELDKNDLLFIEDFLSYECDENFFTRKHDKEYLKEIVKVRNNKRGRL